MRVSLTAWVLDVNFSSLSCRFLDSGADLRVTGTIWSAQGFRQVWGTFLGLLSLNDMACQPYRREERLRGLLLVLLAAQ